MDTSAVGFWRIWCRKSALLSLIISFALCLTGCDTFQSAPAHATKEPTRPIIGQEPQVASSTAPVPERPAPTVEKPSKPAEPQSTSAALPHNREPMPVASPTPLKGAGTLVALSAPAQPRVSEPVATPAAPKPAASTVPKSNKSETTAATSEAPQALFFKGPPHQAVPASHKFLWLGLGLALCGAAGGAIAWLRFSRRKQPVIIPENREEICLPKELMVKECTITAEEPALPEPEPVRVTKKPVVAENKPVLVEKEPEVAQKELALAGKA